MLFTGTTASIWARPPFVGFAAAKAALRTVALGLAREFGPAGLHVAHVVVDGEYARGAFPSFVAARAEDASSIPTKPRTHTGACIVNRAAHEHRNSTCGRSANCSDPAPGTTEETSVSHVHTENLHLR